MFNKIHSLIFSLIILVATATQPVYATGQNTSADNVATNAQGAQGAQTSAPAIPQRGTLYRVRYQDHTSYLFGTIHVGRPEFFPLEEQVTHALSESNALTLEIDLRDAAALQNAGKKYALYEHNDTLDKHVSVKTLTQLKLALAKSGLPYDAVAHLKAWMVANLLLIDSLEKQGYRPDLGTDTVLLQSAETQGKTVEGLESADMQLSLFGAMTEKQQEEYLSETLDDAQSGVMAKKTQELIDAWAIADEKTFEAMLVEAQDDKTTTGKFIYDVLLKKRNPKMAEKIGVLLKQEKNSFVAIGLLHLVGHDGVPQLLKQEGFEVTRLY